MLGYYKHTTADGIICDFKLNCDRSIEVVYCAKSGVLSEAGGQV